jgi:flagellar assembly factor FliW
MALSALSPVETDLSAATIVFPNGLVGCEHWKRFVLLVEDGEDLPVSTLQSLDDPDISLLVTDPSFVVPGYRPELSPEHTAGLGLEDGKDPVLYCTLSIGSDGWVTANLLGPLVVNPTTRQAAQIVLSDTQHSTRHPVVQLGGS